MIKRTVESLARRAGYEIVPKWRVQNLAHARKLKEIFEHFQIAHVLDIGANIGQFRDFLRAQVGYGGPIHSFEPLVSLVHQMEQRGQQDRNWSIYPYALGAADGVRDINVMAATTFSSFLAPSYEAVPELTEPNTISRTERVNVMTLDKAATTLLRDIDFRRTFVKLDTQGFDLEVLDGGRSTFAQIPVLQTEVSLNPIYAGMPSMAESVAQFETAGFAIADLYLVSKDARYRAIELDCIMVR